MKEEVAWAKGVVAQVVGPNGFWAGVEVAKGAGLRRYGVGESSPEPEVAWACDRGMGPNLREGTMSFGISEKEKELANGN